jgi:hypothetical protein
MEVDSPMPKERPWEVIPGGLIRTPAEVTYAATIEVATPPEFITSRLTN